MCNGCGQLGHQLGSQLGACGYLGSGFNGIAAASGYGQNFQMPKSMTPQNYEQSILEYADQYLRKYAAGIKFTNELNSKPPMNTITGKEYLVVASCSIIGAYKDLAEARKVASDQAHKTQGTVYIFQPHTEIAPKRDVVETAITLG